MSQPVIHRTEYTVVFPPLVCLEFVSLCWVFPVSDFIFFFFFFLSFPFFFFFFGIDLEYGIDRTE